MAYKLAEDILKSDKHLLSELKVAKAIVQKVHDIQHRKSVTEVVFLTTQKEKDKLKALVKAMNEIDKAIKLYQDK